MAEEEDGAAVREFEVRVSGDKYHSVPPAEVEDFNGLHSESDIRLLFLADLELGSTPSTRNPLPLEAGYMESETVLTSAFR